MPKRFTPAQVAAAAAAGKPRAKASFPNDEAWHVYQAEWFYTFTSGEELPPARPEASSRASRWKAAVRQHGQVESQRIKETERAPADVLSKRLKVSDKWVAEHAPSVRQLAAASPQVSPAGAHATRRLSATVSTPGGVGVGGSVGATVGVGATQHYVDVRYSLLPTALTVEFGVPCLSETMCVVLTAASCLSAACCQMLTPIKLYIYEKS